jgi:YidC/Oxa1 family membrane protein insertase
MANKPQQRNMTPFLIIWLITTMFMMYTMNNRPKDTRNADELFTEIKKLNAETKDVSVASALGNYEGLLNAQVKDKKLDQAEADKKVREASLLVANTQLRAGLMRNETHRLRLAYQTLWKYQKKMLDQPEWKDTQIAAAADTRFPQIPQTTSGQNLFNITKELISTRNKKEQIWGFIPYGYQFIDGLVSITGKVPAFSYWFGALLLAFVVRLIVFPFSQKTIMHSRQMSQLAPMMTEIKEQFKDDPQQMQMKTMELYREYGLNPAAGCAPAFVQMPLFLTVYQCMLLYEFEFQKGNFLWINESLSKATGGFIAPNLGTQDTILIIIYGISMIVTQFLTPVSDPAQKKQMRIMGIGISVLFTVFMFIGAFPVVGGFVLYWTFTNILATLQSLRAYRLPLEPLQKVNTNPGGTYPKDPSQFFPWMKQPGTNTPPASKSSNGKPTNIKPSTKTGKPQQHKPKK